MYLLYFKKMSNDKATWKKSSYLSIHIYLWVFNFSYDLNDKKYIYILQMFILKNSDAPFLSWLVDIFIAQHQRYWKSNKYTNAHQDTTVIQDCHRNAT